MSPAPQITFRAARCYVPATDPTATLADISTRAIARALKTPSGRLWTVALHQAVSEMAPLIPEGAQLVPVPRASGCLGANLLLVAALARVVPNAVPVLALQRPLPVTSSHQRRRQGLDGLCAATHAASFARAGTLDPHRPVVLIDNVLTTGATVQGAAWALGVSGALAVAFAAAPPMPRHVVGCVSVACAA